MNVAQKLIPINLFLNNDMCLKLNINPDLRILINQMCFEIYITIFKPLSARNEKELPEHTK